MSGTSFLQVQRHSSCADIFTHFRCTMFTIICVLKKNSSEIHTCKTRITFTNRLSLAHLFSERDREAREDTIIAFLESNICEQQDRSWLAELHLQRGEATLRTRVSSVFPWASNIHQSSHRVTIQQRPSQLLSFPINQCIQMHPSLNTAHIVFFSTTEMFSCSIECYGVVTLDSSSSHLQLTEGGREPLFPLPSLFLHRRC